MPPSPERNEEDPSNERAKPRSFHHSSYSPARIAAARAERGLGVSVCLPARECAATVGEIVGALVALREAGAIDEVVVIDAGSADGTGAAARFSDPYGLAVTSGGTLFVADSSNETIRKVTPAGVVTTLAGTASASGSADGTGAVARFDNPFGIAVDSVRGLLYVADTSGDTIRKIS